MRPAIRMKHKPLWLTPEGIGFPKYLDNEISSCTGGNIPGDDLSGVEIQNDAEIAPVARDPDVSDVAHPDEVRSLLFEVLLQLVIAVR